MEIFGYNEGEKREDNLLTMQEICLQLSLDEIDELIKFLTYVRQRHESVADVAYCPHTHYSEWKYNSYDIKPDIVISTPFPQNTPTHIDT